VERAKSFGILIEARGGGGVGSLNAEIGKGKTSPLINTGDTDLSGIPG